MSLLKTSRNAQMIRIENVVNKNIPDELLFLADPDINKIKEYKDDSIFFAAIYNDRIIGQICIKEFKNKKCEIMNISVFPEFQNKGFGRKLLEYAINYFKDTNLDELIIKTGNSSLSQLALYMKTGFRMTKINYNYFIENYNEEIFENNIRCSDQVVLTYKLI